MKQHRLVMSLSKNCVQDIFFLSFPLGLLICETNVSDGDILDSDLKDRAVNSEIPSTEMRVQRFLEIMLQILNVGYVSSFRCLKYR